MGPRNPEVALAIGLTETPVSSQENSPPHDFPYDRFLSENEQIMKHVPLWPPKGRANGSKKTRLGLPITLDPRGIAATVLGCADTGADVNIISEELAIALGHTQYDHLASPKLFKLANGNIIQAIGRISSSCAFGVELESSVVMLCEFYVLKKVVSPIIMGLKFLEQTKTMTRHRERLVRVPRPALQALSVCSINQPRRYIKCLLNRRPTLATPDTGSEIDLISPEEASELGLYIRPGEEALELADGTMAFMSGYVRATVALNESFLRDEHSLAYIAVEFHVLPGLAHAKLLGEETLEQLKIFTHHEESLIVATEDTPVFNLNTIRHLGTFDKLISRTKETFGSRLSSILVPGKSLELTQCRLRYFVC
jgi:hypothetical protein